MQEPQQFAERRQSRRISPSWLLTEVSKQGFALKWSQVRTLDLSREGIGIIGRHLNLKEGAKVLINLTYAPHTRDAVPVIGKKLEGIVRNYHEEGGGQIRCGIEFLGKRTLSQLEEIMASVTFDQPEKPLSAT